MKKAIRFLTLSLFALVVTSSSSCFLPFVFYSCDDVSEYDVKLQEYVNSVVFPEILSEPLVVHYDFDSEQRFFSDIWLYISVIYGTPDNLVTFTDDYDAQLFTITPGTASEDTLLDLHINLMGSSQYVTADTLRNLKQTPPCEGPHAYRVVTVTIPKTI